MNDVQKKLNSFSNRIENEKRRELEEEENRKKQEMQERMLAEQQQKEMKRYVENKIKEFTGLEYILTPKVGDCETRQACLKP